jgi:transcriptional regulator with XRE-family HTH domain
MKTMETINVDESRTRLTGRRIAAPRPIRLTKTRFGDVLRRFRTASGLGVRELAKHVDMRASSISQYENGLQTPSAAAVRRISAALKVPPDLLLWYAFNVQTGERSKSSVFRQVDDLMARQVKLFESAMKERVAGQRSS